MASRTFLHAYIKPAALGTYLTDVRTISKQTAKIGLLRDLITEADVNDTNCLLLNGLLSPRVFAFFVGSLTTLVVVDHLHKNNHF